jgi:hypothetical protein
VDAIGCGRACRSGRRVDVIVGRDIVVMEEREGKGKEENFGSSTLTQFIRSPRL